ncbi:hypothetical protein [Leeuwenhoekiella parthenopeia]|uniref:Uncharacterized protein n=1 Tax=Leeuwenhoekiella parthenopeia TaxID=2890320 RepID=A0ABS8GRQ3_9FLAO|nr:hypothetical protein [Leeuwenhoekiella parthenopeia]MCC4212604.1 hypothetical protein [Leeuwenhoekiella parthenopeia]
MAAPYTYRILAEVLVYHRYFLDDGNTPFDQSPALKQQQLRDYYWTAFASVKPTAQTNAHLRNHRLFLKQTPHGFNIAVQALAQNPNATVFKPVIDLDENLQLDFVINVHDALFANYSNLDTVTHYPLLFRNYNDLIEPALPLINTASGTTEAAQYGISAGTQKSLIENNPEDQLLRSKALVSLKMRGEGNGRNLILASGNLPQEHPVYSIRFDNRNTIWNYYSGKNQNLIHSTDPNTKPLVKNGVVEVSQGNTDYPAASPNTVVWERDSVGTLIKTYSKIYIN